MTIMKQNADMYGYYAGFVSRLFAFVLDVIILVVAITLITWLITFVEGLFNIEAFFGGNVISVIVTALLTFGVYIGYPLFFWTLTGQTPGMMLMGLRVVTTDGHYVSLGRSIRRLIGYVIAALPFFLGFFWILVDDRRQGWHDKIAGTCVVYTWHARPDETFFRKLLDS
jgi:uncharacterized RDD family membrane protein YckC